MNGKLAEELAGLREATEKMADRLALVELNEDESRLTIGELWEGWTSPEDTPQDSESMAKGLRFLRRYGLADACIYDGFLLGTSNGTFLVSAQGDDEGSNGAVHLAHWGNQRIRIAFVGPVRESGE